MILLLAWLPLLAKAVEFDEHLRTLALGDAVRVLEDPSAALTIDEVASPAMAGRFRALKNNALSAGFTHSAFWMRVELTYRPTRPLAMQFLLELAYPPMDYIDLYVPDANGIPRLAWQTGDMLPFSSRQVRQHNYLFPLDLPPEQSRTLYLRVASHGFIQAPLNLWSSQAYIEAQPGRLYLLGAIYGVLLGLLAYNLFVYLTVRDPIYLWYILHLGSFALFQLSLNGVGIEFLWPDSPWWANACTTFFIAAAVLFAAGFSRGFLDTPRLARWADVALRLVGAAALIVMAWSLLGDESVALRLVIVLLVTFIPLALSIGVLALRNGRRVARYFVTAWLALGVGVAIKFLMMMDVLQSGFLVMYSSHIGVMAEVALLSLALGDRVNWLREQQAQGLAVATENLAQVNRQLATSNRLKDEFLATLTHELRTPMNGVIGSLELMQGGVVDDETEIYRQAAARSAQAMMGMIDGILTLTELQAGRLQVRIQPFNLRALLSELRGEHGYRAHDKGLGFVVSASETLPDTMQGDVVKLRQCLDCLLDNALKFTSQGHVALHVSTCGSLEWPGQPNLVRVRFDVSDTGIGFGPLEEATLYQSFFQADSSTTRQYDGLGIGLAISRRLVELMGGELHHQSKPGHGSHFFLELPLTLVKPATQDSLAVIHERHDRP